MTLTFAEFGGRTDSTLGPESKPEFAAPSSMAAGNSTAYPSTMANVVDYFELAVDDLADAKAFYAKALGWAFNDYGPDYAGID